MSIGYDQLINGDDAYIKLIARAYAQKHGHAMSETDLAHNIWRLLREGWTIEDVLSDIAGEDAPPPHQPQPPFPIPPSSVGLTSWPRRGATIAQSLLDTRWDYAQWANILGGRFAGRALTQVNILSAEWPENAPFFERPFVKRPNGLFDLRQVNQAFYDRLARYVEAMNLHGVVVQLCFLDLYSWSYRKQGMPFEKRLSPFSHNVNGVDWLSTDRASDDRVLAMLPDDFLVEIVERVVTTVKGAGVAVVPFNEGPEKHIHTDIAEIVKRIDPSMRVVTNRNDDTPGQYQNMDVGEGLIDMIAFHGWKNTGFLTKDFSPKPDELSTPAKAKKASQRPWTFTEFFDGTFHNGTPGGFDFSRIIASSDGSRSSDDPVNTYNWTELLRVFRFVVEHGGSIEHQSRAKMGANQPRLDTVEIDFLDQMAAL